MISSPLIPERTALLLMDLQHSLLSALPGAERILRAAQRAQRAALDAGIREIHVRVAFTPEDHAAVPAHNKAFAPVARAGALAATEPENEVHPALREAHEDQPLTVTKTRVSAFSTGSLDPLLREQGIDTLVLGGIFTSGVILSTVRDGADKDYRLLVLGDVCGDPDQQLHDTLITSLLPSQADVIDVAAFEAAARTEAAR
ncbi:cysteine hydrolase family protein [Streptomyces arenae]|uniref:cysteine hydrolase family protein n=1 Tax=Streptomyces arenae TaxID=29301 RepID=UPI00265A50A1|nr:cysteine hydrolase [Streptomyces arenae]MCG7205139.1 cysteine hydrolase [Streptomyces arenae]